jgi:hypothetical protein
MATINIMVGQCGTQLGAAFLEAVAEEAQGSKDDVFRASVSDTFFRDSRRGDGGPSGNQVPIARSVLIDMEPKVIESTTIAAERRGLFQFSARHSVTRNEGSANNWAFGFHQQGPSRRSEIVDNIRKEFELADSVAYVHVTHSASGGTGSGVGCYVSQTVRDEFPRALLHHSVVWPFEHGEMTTQWFNAAHTISQVHHYADSIQLLSNDDVLGKPAVGERPELGDINHAMSSLMASLHLPSTVAEVPPAADLQKRSKLISAGRQLTAFTPMAYHRASWADVVEAIALDPRRKVFEGMTMPPAKRGRTASSSFEGGGGLAQTANVSWQAVLPDPLRYGYRRGAHSALMILRGARALEEGSVDLQGALRVQPLYVLNGLHVASQPMQGNVAHASLFGPTRALSEKFSHCAEKCEAMVESGAFLHHYQRYGTGKEEFQDTLLTLYALAQAYQQQ